MVLNVGIWDSFRRRLPCTQCEPKRGRVVTHHCARCVKRQWREESARRSGRRGGLGVRRGGATGNPRKESQKYRVAAAAACPVLLGAKMDDWRRNVWVYRNTSVYVHHIRSIYVGFDLGGYWLNQLEKDLCLAKVSSFHDKNLRGHQLTKISKVGILYGKNDRVCSQFSYKCT